MIKLWVDDIRPAPPGWKVAKTFEEAVALFDTGECSHVSLDHDLGGQETGYDLIQYFHMKLYLTKGWIGNRYPIIYVHSANPVGAERVESFIYRHMPECVPPDVKQRYRKDFTR